MSKRIYPCDGPECCCPYNAEYSRDCYNNCGLGAYEEEPDEINYEHIPDDELEEPMTP